MFYFCIQWEFSDDIVKIIQAAINSDGGQPEIKKANSMVKSFFIRVNEIHSSCFNAHCVIALLIPFFLLLALRCVEASWVFFLSSNSLGGGWEVGKVTSINGSLPWPEILLILTATLVCSWFYSVSP